MTDAALTQLCRDVDSLRAWLAARTVGMQRAPAARRARARTAAPRPSP